MMQDLTKWCADCLYELRGANHRLDQFNSDAEMFAALDARSEQATTAAGYTLHPLAEILWQGTPLCMDHFRSLRAEQLRGRR